MLIRSGQSAAIPTIKVVPTYTQAKLGDIFTVQLEIFGAAYADLTDVYTWQVRISWNPAVLDFAYGTTWGAFMEGPRIGYWGDMIYDAPAGQNTVNVTDGSKFTAGIFVYIRDDFHSETNNITLVEGNMLTVLTPLAYTYRAVDHAGAYPDPNMGYTGPIVNQAGGNATLGGTTTGTVPGAQGDGVLATLNFNVEQNADTTLSIDNQYTYIINFIGETKGDNPGELNKINGYKAWAEDISANGVIGVNDLYWVGKDYQKCPIQPRDPTATAVVTAGWSGTGNAYTSNNVRASSTTGGAAQAYKTYGFATTGWTGIAKVEVGLERIYAGATGDDTVTIAISKDGGLNWLATTFTVTPTGTDTFSWYDFTAATAWTVADMPNIAVKITYNKVGATGTIIGIDWIPVRVTPTPTSTNAYSDITRDGVDNSADLTQLAAKYGQTYGP